MTPAQIVQTLEDLAWALESAHAIPAAYWDYAEATAGSLSPDGVGIIASLIGVEHYKLQRALDVMKAAIPRAKGLLASDVSVKFAAFLRDAESRPILINIISRWL